MCQGDKDKGLHVSFLVIYVHPPSVNCKKLEVNPDRKLPGHAVLYMGLNKMNLVNVTACTGMRGALDPACEYNCLLVSSAWYNTSNPWIMTV